MAKRRRSRGLGSSAVEHARVEDHHIESGISQAQRALGAAQEGRCKVAYDALKRARWDNGAAWAHSDSGGRTRTDRNLTKPGLAQFDRELQHADDTFRNRCLS